MFRQLKKNLVATLIAAVALGQVAPAFADPADTLPDMGTSAGSTLSIGQEMQMGDFYVRQLRGSAPLINDPLLVQYINALGMRLVSHADSVKTPFHFFLINNDEINAFAFFGGNVVLHSALFRYADNESQLASVMAHEISPRYATPPGARDGRSKAQRAAHMGGRARLHFAGNGQPTGRYGGANRHSGGNAPGDDKLHSAE
ncbi:Exported zinc metalloprotease YfgC precursor [Salmonella enterica subsp. arizonae]|uniref:Exported zinc metalloprotease YfgC n=1 Tax=Salmonella enterica subsp. arizonae TaxID=59203 RepID=A0A379TA50_SALER|nr:Exported zinc metalloprotease YfgC precursor [Salmonella enterica subsp. arizonae]